MHQVSPSTGILAFLCLYTKICSQFTFRSYMTEESIPFNTRITLEAEVPSHQRKDGEPQTGQGTAGPNSHLMLTVGHTSIEGMTEASTLFKQ